MTIDQQPGRGYPLEGLNERDLDPDPFRQFADWFAQAREAGALDPNAMALATATPDGVPSARMVLLNGFDERGFVFYTNYESRKGRELAENPRAALVFYWPAQRRQVRVEGTVEPLPPAESDAYFARRPRGSRLGAWASRQSEVIPGREALDRVVAEIARRYGEGEIPRPPYWGGYRVLPALFEFWQSRPDRLHDRFRYTLTGGPGAGWRIERLSP